MNKVSIDNGLVASIGMYVKAAKRDLVNACANALRCGACLNAWCAISGQNLSYIVNIIKDGGVSRATLFRWANAYQTACMILGVDSPPEPGTNGWDDHLAALDGVAEGMTISRLQLGAPSSRGDLARLDQLQTGLETAEDADEEAIYVNAMAKVESGEWSLIDALRAVGSQTAQEKATERRREVVYLAIDEKTNNPKGTLPGAVNSLKIGFGRWNNFDGESKRAFAHMWKDLQAFVPADLKKYL